MGNRLPRIAFPILILIAGIAIFVVLKRTKPTAEKVERSDPGALVEVVEATVESKGVEVVAQGTVIPAREVLLSSEVAGSVKWVHADLAPGSRFRAGNVLVRIDARDFQLAVAQQAAAVDKARTELQIERGRKKVAEREWELFGKEENKVGAPEDPDTENLALREPQLRTARAALDAAQSGLNRAALAVNKTTIRAPFNSMVKNETVELGQMVGPATPLMTLVGTDAFRVQVSVPIERLAWLKVPGIGDESEGSKVRVIQKVGPERVEREGQVIQLLGDVDPAGRMARVLVEIDDPLSLAKGAKKTGLPLLLGAYVDVIAEGKVVEDVVQLPRVALRDGDRVFLYSSDSTLLMKPVSVVWSTSESVLLRGLKSGDRVITSPVPTAVEGMKLRSTSDLKVIEKPETVEDAGETPAVPSAAKPTPAESAP